MQMCAVLMCALLSLVSADSCESACQATYEAAISDDNCDHDLGEDGCETLAWDSYKACLGEC